MATSESGRTPPPPNGWEPLREETVDGADLLTQLGRLVSDAIPEDLQRRLIEAVRELLVALQALIEWLVTRLERRPSAGVEVRDIPVL